MEAEKINEGNGNNMNKKELFQKGYLTSVKGVFDSIDLLKCAGFDDDFIKSVINMAYDTGIVIRSMSFDNIGIGKVLTFYPADRDWDEGDECFSALAFVYNIESPNCSELGTVRIAKNGDCFMRIA